MYIISIKFIVAFGKEDKIVELTTASGGGGGGYTIMIDNYYYGKILNQMGGWRVDFQIYNPDYTAAELQILIDLVTGYEV